MDFRHSYCCHNISYNIEEDKIKKIDNSLEKEYICRCAAYPDKHPEKRNPLISDRNSEQKCIYGFLETECIEDKILFDVFLKSLNIVTKYTTYSDFTAYLASNNIDIDYYHGTGVLEAIFGHLNRRFYYLGAEDEKKELDNFLEEFIKKYLIE